MAQFGGLQGLGGPINYYDQMTPDFRGEALKASQANAMDIQSMARRQEMVQQQKDEARKQQFFEVMKTAKPEDLPSVRQQFPDFAQNVQQEIGIQDEEHARFVNKALGRLSVAMQSNDPAQIAQAIQSGNAAWSSLGTSADAINGLIQNDPQQANALLRGAYMSTLPFEKQADITHKQDVLKENARQADMQNSTTIRGQNIAAENARRSAGGSSPASVKEYQYFQSLGPEQQKTYLRVKGRNGSEGLQQAQLSNGETVMIEPKPRGAGANMFYPGIDANGNVISVPVSSLAATSDASSSTNQNLVSSDLAKITGATPDQLSVLTGFTGGIGENPITSDIRTRLGDKETRDIFRAAQRVQGYMLKQGVSDAKNMGASGINTAAEAKMYFQAAPQLDYSSPEAMVDSGRALDEYTRSFNSRHNVNYKKGSQQPATTQQQAPAAAIQALQANPSLAPQFKAKYGYLP